MTVEVRLKYLNDIIIVFHGTLDFFSNSLIKHRNVIKLLLVSSKKKFFAKKIHAE
jgi:hypothetical protein